MTSIACTNAATADTDPVGHDKGIVPKGIVSTPPSETSLLFSGVDLWRHGAFSHGGLLWSPDGLDREGFTLKLLIGGGQYRYLSGALGNVEVTGTQSIAFIMPGWRLRNDNLTLSVFAGLDVQHHKLSPDDPGNRLRGTKTGIRAGVDAWFEPDTRSMLNADASVSSVGPSYSARLAFGWRLAGFYVGPEIGGFASGAHYRQFRAGMHITALRAGALEWSGGMGFATDSDHRDSLYARLGLIVRR
jgi:hypothetical protein